jgi:hypothetical protein
MIIVASSTMIAMRERGLVGYSAVEEIARNEA